MNMSIYMMNSWTNWVFYSTAGGLHFVSELFWPEDGSDVGKYKAHDHIADDEGLYTVYRQYDVKCIYI